MILAPASPSLVAILGPTNTGKTYLAVERMLRHSSGMMGFPLRLLARENYDRLVKKLGLGAVALITGEERIVPAKPSYYICTVEAMLQDKVVDFIGIDEVQLAADPERGHAFTDRILHMRGRQETVFVGAETIRPILEALFPTLEVIVRPRFSTLAYSGHKKLTKLPPQTAIIAFSADDVYRMAELVRQRQGGAAVVMGALSPRTRNAQVAMYQAGEVDTIVATDAIGMGLNMNIEHVAFSRLSKFDGRIVRPLHDYEVGQIAGRAGRHTADGTFGGTEGVQEFPEDLVAAVEAHQFAPLQALMWRSRELDFASAPRLLKSLEVKSEIPLLRRAPQQEDAQALAALLQDSDVQARLGKPAELFTLWEVCQIPDFEKLLSDSYLRFIKQLFLHLTSHHGALPADWVQEQVARIDNIEGDIDTLTTRIGRIRTWTYISNRSGWLREGAYWQQRTRAIEDKLSDSLHEKLTERFVERRAGIGPKGRLFCYVAGDNTVLIDGRRVGWFNGFHFNPDHEAKTYHEARDVLKSIRTALVHTAAERAQALINAMDADIHFNSRAEFVWNKAIIGRAVKGADLLRPAVQVAEQDYLSPALRQQVEQRLAQVLAAWLQKTVPSLYELATLKLTPPARGIAYQLSAALGTLQRQDVAELIDSITKEDRIIFGGCGVHLGSTLIWVDKLWSPEAMRARALLWSLWAGQPLPAPPQGKSLPVATLPKPAWHALGYSVLAQHAVRADVVEEVIPLLHQKPCPPAVNLAKSLGVSVADLPHVLKALGYFVKQGEKDATGQRALVVFKQKAHHHKPKKAAAPLDASTAAAYLQALWQGK